MKLSQLLPSAAMLSASLALLAACEGGAKQGASGASGFVHPLPDSTVLMKYNGGTITAKDVTEFVKPQLKKFDEEALEIYKRSAERALLMKLLDAEAKKQGVATPEALMSKVVSEVTVDDKQAQEFIKAQKLDKPQLNPRTGKMQKVSIDEVKGYLTEQEKQNRQQAYLQGLLSQANAQVVLEEPRTEVKLSGKEPFKGGANAKVVINEFSDFQCPFCARGRTVADEIAKAYGDKVKIVFRHFPLSFHQQAKPAAIAATCAQEQGKFWEFHDKLFENQSALADADLNKYAKDLALDAAKFEACVKNPETAKVVDKDMEVAEQVGVNSTPTFFVNGRRVAGALPFDKFKSMIDAELAK